MTTALGSLALEMGFLTRELRVAQEAIWEMHDTFREELRWRVMHQPHYVLHEMDETMLGLSHLGTPQQMETFRSLKERTEARDQRTSEFVTEKLHLALRKPDPRAVFAKTKSAPLSKLYQGQQEEDWRCLSNLVQAVIRRHPRLHAWFEIGNRTARTYYRLLRGGSPQRGFTLDSVYAPTWRLGSEERKTVEGVLPHDYRDVEHLMFQLIETRNCFRTLLDRHETELIAVPHWDGSVLSFRGQRTPIKVQSGGVIDQVLKAFQDRGWPEAVTLNIEGDLPHARLHFHSKKPPIRLSISGSSVRWEASSDMVFSFTSH